MASHRSNETERCYLFHATKKGYRFQVKLSPSSFHWSKPPNVELSWGVVGFTVPSLENPNRKPQTLEVAMNRQTGLLTMAVLVLFASYSMAGTVSVMVGDHDGYGPVGCADNSPPGTCIWPGLGPSGTGYDGRDAAEIAATNGAQITDIYSAIFPGFGPNTSTTANVLFPFSGTLTSGSLTIGMGDFQASSFGDISVMINGIPEPGLFHFDDGFQATALRSFTLGPAELAAANAAGQVDLFLDRNGSGDFIAFDFFQLNGTTTPEPGTIALFGSGLVGLAGVLRRKFRA
jgi:hypothetical protein